MAQLLTAWGWVKGLGWRAGAALLVGLTLGWYAGRGSRSSVAEAEVARMEGADKGAEKNLRSQLAALKAEKDSEIRALRERLANIDCDGTWTRETEGDGTVIERCVGKSHMVTEERGNDTNKRTTPLLPPPFIPPPPLVLKDDLLWQAGIGGGYQDGAPVFYGRLGYRFLGPWGAEGIVLYPLGAMGGVNYSW